ncbi:MAG: hypothetical protein U9N84_10255 [Actinomycetota bacterium]|nr:hypothetical protein [Actinomycetota bacterium]
MNRVVGAFACLPLLLAACGDDSTAPTTSLGSSAPVSSTTVAIAEFDVVAIEVPPCDLVTAAEVAAATGLAVSEVRDTPPFSCVFGLGEEAGVAVFVNADDGQGRLSAPAAVFDAYTAMAVDGSAELISDLGDSAAYAQGFRGLAIDAGGGKYIALGVSGGYQELESPFDALVELARAALGRL